MKFKNGVYATKVELAKTLRQAIGMMEAMIKWFGKREMLYAILDQGTGKAVCWEVNKQT